MADPVHDRMDSDSGALRAVLLDSLGTLVALEPPGPRLRVELGRRGIDVSEEEARAAFGMEIHFYLEHHLEGSSAAALERLRDDCAGVLAGSLGIEPHRHATVREAMLAALRFAPYPDAAPALRALRAAGLRLVVASNWDCSLAGALAAAGLRTLVDGVVTSAEVGSAKPDPALFRAALEVAGCAADTAVVVGDSPENDLAGARAAGIDAILLARNAPARPVHTPAARSLDEARSLILAGV